MMLYPNLYSNIFFWRNAEAIESVSYDYIFLDPPSENITKRLGTVERTETLLNHYHGHIY